MCYQRGDAINIDMLADGDLLGSSRPPYIWHFTARAMEPTRSLAAHCGACERTLVQVERRSRVSAGLLMFRHGDAGLELLLAHPGGPFFAKKDAGAWTIPKGEAAPDEDLLTRARIEFEEEVGIAATSDRWIDLGSIKQKGGKTVHAWGFEGDLPDGFVVTSNEFEMEWPPRSGRRARFPEVDQACFFDEPTAREKIKATQLPLIDRLREHLAGAED